MMIASMPLIAVRDSACMQQAHALLDMLIVQITGWRLFCSTLAVLASSRRMHTVRFVRKQVHFANSLSQEYDSRPSRHTRPVYMRTTEVAGLVDASVRCPNDPQQSRSDVTAR